MRKVYLLAVLLLFCKLSNAQWDYPTEVYLNGHLWSGINQNCPTITLTLAGTNVPDSVVWYCMDLGYVVARGYTVTLPGDLLITLQLYKNGINYDNDTYVWDGSPIVLNTTVQNVTTYGGNNGSIDLSVTGGSSPYSYLWSTSQTTQDISSLTASNYSVIVKDANGCPATKSETITQPPPIDWGTFGNANTDSTVQFLGTTDSKPLIIKTNNTERIHIEKGGKVIFKSPIEVDEITLKKPLKIDTLKINRIMPQDGDTLVRIGTGSVNFSLINRIFGTSSTTNTGTFNGITIGDASSYSKASVGFSCGSFSRIEPNSDQSFAFGNKVRVSNNAINAVVIGSGSNYSIFNSTNDFLNNTISNSVLIGANSPVPSLAILPGTSTTCGNIGIGTTSPGTKLHIKVDGSDTYGGIYLDKNSTTTPHSEIRFMQSGNERWSIGTDYSHTGTNDDFFIYKANVGPVFTILNDNGNVAVGINCHPASVNPGNRDPNYKLYVEGSIACRELKVTAQGFPDYVFNNKYKLMPLNDLQAYIDSSHHLPGLPPEKEVIENNGYEVGKLQMKLLEKIEEQTIYILGLQKQIDELKSKVDNR